jgi:hypothetical protein
MTAVTTIYSYAGRGFHPAGSAWIFASGTVGPNGVMYTPNSPGQVLGIPGHRDRIFVLVGAAALGIAVFALLRRDA